MLTPELNIKEAMTAFDRTETETLVVVDNPAELRVLGLLTETYATRRYAEELDKANRGLTGKARRSGRGLVLEITTLDHAAQPFIGFTQLLEGGAAIGQGLDLLAGWNAAGVPPSRARPSPTGRGRWRPPQPGVASRPG